MAKVRIQARSADSEDSARSQSVKPHPCHRERSKHIGALNVLARVWKRQGFVGWYQVIPILDGSSILSHLSLVGNASADHKSSPFTSFAFHVERTI